MIFISEVSVYLDNYLNDKELFYFVNFVYMSVKKGYFMRTWDFCVSKKARISVVVVAQTRVPYHFTLIIKEFFP